MIFSQKTFRSLPKTDNIKLDFDACSFVDNPTGIFKNYFIMYDAGTIYCLTGVVGAKLSLGGGYNYGAAETVFIPSGYWTSGSLTATSLFPAPPRGAFFAGISGTLPLTYPLFQGFVYANEVRAFPCPTTPTNKRVVWIGGEGGGNTLSGASGVSSPNTSTCYTEFGVSGEGKTFLLKYDEMGLWSHDSKLLAGVQFPGETWDISMNVGTTSYQVMIGEEMIIGNGSKNNFKVENLIINPVNQTMSSEVRAYTHPISYDVTIPEAFQSQSSTDLTVVNSSQDVDFRVFSYEAEYYSRNFEVFEGSVSGAVSGNNWAKFVLNDVSKTKFDENINFKITLQTNFGKIVKELSIDRLSGLADEFHSIVRASDNLLISPVFFGESGLNSFTFKSTDLSDSMYWNYYASKAGGKNVEKTMTVTLSPVSPAANGVYSTQYITGFQLTSTGRYDICPSIKTTGYYYVEDITFADNSMIFSSGCTGSIPITFKSVNGVGSGGSGLAIGNTVKYYGIFDNSTYLQISDIQVLNGGTGYNMPPTLSPNTGVYANCYDVPAKFGSTMTFTPFAATAVMAPSAAYLSGEVVCQEVLTGAGVFDCFKIVGLGITNPGFGYNQTDYEPKMTFIRADGDTETLNAAGKFLFYTGTGYYDFGSVWSLETGLVRDSLSEVEELQFVDPFVSLLEPPSSGAVFSESYDAELIEQDTLSFSESTILRAEDYQLYGRITYSAIDYTGSVVAMLKVVGENGSELSMLITGTNSYSSDPAYLKKNFFNLNYEPTSDEEIDFFFEEYVGDYDFLDGSVIGDEEDL